VVRAGFCTRVEGEGGGVGEGGGGDSRTCNDGVISDDSDVTPTGFAVAIQGTEIRIGGAGVVENQGSGSGEQVAGVGEGCAGAVASAERAGHKGHAGWQRIGDGDVESSVQAAADVFNHEGIGDDVAGVYAG